MRRPPHRSHKKHRTFTPNRIRTDHCFIFLYKVHTIKMRKSSAHTPRDNKAGSKSTFRKSEGPGSDSRGGRPSAKKNYDGRSSSSDSRPPHKAKPYSGRTTDGDKPARPFSAGPKEFGSSRAASAGPGRPERTNSDRKPYGKPSFRKEEGSDRGERKPYRDSAGGGKNESRPFSDRPKRADSDRKPYGKPSFRKEEGSDRNERKPYRDSASSERNENRPFSDRPKRADSDRKPFGKPPRRDFDKDKRADGDARPFRARPAREDGKPSFGKPPRKEFDKDKRAGGDSRPFRERPNRDGGKPPFNKSGRGAKPDEKDTKTTFKDVMNNAFNQPKSAQKKDPNAYEPMKPEQFEDQVFGELEEETNENKPKKPFEIKKKTNPRFNHDHSEGRKKKYKDEEDEDDEEDKEINQTNGPRLEMPLNKFIAHSGECSRRDAAALVKQGKVKVNEELVLDPGYRVKHDDKVTMSGKKLTPQKGMVYILLNKPKGFITTNDDPQGRKTVMELVGNSGVDRLFPVGRLDKETSGLLLITNDGELTQKLCHPSYKIKKVYQVTLDKPLTKADFEKIMEGVDLEDGIAKVDALAYLERKDELGLEIHSGRNRIVRRIFESLKYEVVKLDRVMYAGLTKKNLPRSKWRYLDEREVVLLKHFKS